MIFLFLILLIESITKSIPKVLIISPIKELIRIIKPDNNPPTIIIIKSVIRSALPIFISEYFFTISAIISVPPELEFE